MAVLSNSDRNAVCKRVMKHLSDRRTPMALTKPDLQAAIAAADAWVEANAAAFNTALPLAARSALTANQKAELLAEIAFKRFEV